MWNRDLEKEKMEYPVWLTIINFILSIFNCEIYRQLEEVEEDGYEVIYHNYYFWRNQKKIDK